MTEHLSSQTIDLLAGRRLVPEDLLTATRHLANCEQCRQRASEAADAITRAPAFRADLQLAAAETPHLDYEQFEDYVNDSLSIKDREIAKRHLASCVACLKEARELESVRDNLTTYPALSDVTVASRKRPGAWERLASLIQLRPGKLAFLAAMLALIAVVTALLIWRPAPRQLANKNSAPPNNIETNQNSQVAGASKAPSNSNQLASGTESAMTAAPFEGIIKQAMETQQLTAPTAIRDLAGKESRLLGSSEKLDRFALLSPVGTLIRSSRPTLRWQDLPGATSYNVAILDLDLNVIEKSDPITGKSWTPQRQLKRNVIYIWQVTAIRDGREITAPAAPAREARFKILSSEKASALSGISSEIANSHLKLGIVYAHDGLLDDAEREFRAAIAADEDAAIARKLLQAARQMRR
jgi:hypothetical protein